jgi:hypothetical protein
VVAWGAGGFSLIQPPLALSDVVALAGGFNGCLALKNDGTVVAWGDNSRGQENIPSGLNNVVGIASGWYHNLAIVGDGKPVITSYVSRRSVGIGGTLRLAALATGAQPLRYQWQFQLADIPGATNATLTLANVSLNDSGDYRCIVSNDLESLNGPVTRLTVLREPLRFDTSPDALSLANNVVHLRLSGLVGAGPVTVYASTNLIDWEPVFNQAPVTGTLDFSDPTATNHPARYYKATEGP